VLVVGFERVVADPCLIRTPSGRTRYLVLSSALNRPLTRPLVAGTTWPRKRMMSALPKLVRA
jgi:hypothetical protein